MRIIEVCLRRSGSVAYAQGQRFKVWSDRRDARFFRGGSPGIADAHGRNADAISIGPVHSECTVVDGGLWRLHHAALRARLHLLDRRTGDRLAPFLQEVAAVG